MSGPPSGAPAGRGGGGAAGGGGGPPTPEQIAIYKEMGIRKLFPGDIGAGFGPFIMGYVFNLLMLGILLAQIWHWYSWNGKKERNFVRVVVFVVLVFSTASSIFTVNWFVYLFVDNYGKYAQFVNNAWFSWIPIIDQPAILACHLFNLERAYRLNHNSKLVLFIIGPFILTATAVIIARKAIVGSTDFNAATVIKPYMYTFFGCVVTADILLTASIGWGLYKSKTGWKHTDALIKRIIVYTVETQLLPSIAALAMTVQYAINSDTWMAFIYIIAHAKIPAVMMMAVLNYRLSLQRDQSRAQQMSTTGLKKAQNTMSDDDSWNGTRLMMQKAESDGIPMTLRYNQSRGNESQLPLALPEKGSLRE